jgi:hypothetical protein
MYSSLCLLDSLREAQRQAQCEARQRGRWALLDFAETAQREQ